MAKCSFYRYAVTTVANDTFSQYDMKFKVNIRKWCEHPKVKCPGHSIAESIHCEGDLGQCVLPSEERCEFEK